MIYPSRVYFFSCSGFIGFIGLGAAFIGVFLPFLSGVWFGGSGLKETPLFELEHTQGGWSGDEMTGIY